MKILDLCIVGIMLSFLFQAPSAHSFEPALYFKGMPEIGSAFKDLECNSDEAIKDTQPKIKMAYSVLVCKKNKNQSERRTIANYGIIISESFSFYGEIASVTNIKCDKDSLTSLLPKFKSSFSEEKAPFSGILAITFVKDKAYLKIACMKSGRFFMITRGQDVSNKIDKENFSIDEFVKSAIGVAFWMHKFPSNDNVLKETWKKQELDMLSFVNKAVPENPAQEKIFANMRKNFVDWGILDTKYCLDHCDFNRK